MKTYYEKATEVKWKCNEKENKNGNGNGNENLCVPCVSCGCVLNCVVCKIREHTASGGAS